MSQITAHPSSFSSSSSFHPSAFIPHPYSSRRLRQELSERLGHNLQPAAEGLVDRVLHRPLEAAHHLLVRRHAEFSHLVDRPDPDVIFLFAAHPVAVEADRVMP